MSSLSRTIAGSTFAFALTLGMAVGAAAQETPVPVPVPDPEVEVEMDAAPAQAEASEPVVVVLTAVEGGEGAGEATLTAGDGDQTEAVVEVEGLAPAEYSAFLIAGSCEQPGELVTPLGTIAVADEGTGRGEAALTTAFAELTSGEATVQVHPAGEQPSEPVLCGVVATAPAF